MKTLITVWIIAIIIFWIIGEQYKKTEVKCDIYHCTNCHRDWQESALHGTLDDIRCPVCMGEVEKKI